MQYQAIQPYVDKGLVSEVRHPYDHNVAIFNYTPRCQFEGAWDEITKQCRGLIMNVATGEILARPFPKFFNYEEYIAKGWTLPTGPMVISEKMDGSLGILYELQGKPWIATRGSFMSEQAQWATKWWREQMGDCISLKGETHLFEIVYPANRIVVSYDFSGLVYLATIDNKTGRDAFFLWRGLQARKIQSCSFEELRKKEETNKEGFVVYFPQEGVRIKLKFAEYIRLHKIITGLSEIGIWEHMRDEKEFDELVDRVPDEFYAWVKKVYLRLRMEYLEIVGAARRIADEVKSLPTMKEQALAVQAATDREHVRHVAYAMLKDRPYAPIVFKFIRPHGHRPFRVDIDS